MGMILPLVLMLALMYFMLIRPENKRKKEAAAKRASLAVGMRSPPSAASWAPSAR